MSSNAQNNTTNPPVLNDNHSGMMSSTMMGVAVACAVIGTRLLIGAIAVCLYCLKKQASPPAVIIHTPATPLPETSLFDNDLEMQKRTLTL